MRRRDRPDRGPACSCVGAGRPRRGSAAAAHAFPVGDGQALVEPGHRTDAAPGMSAFRLRPVRGRWGAARCRCGRMRARPPGLGPRPEERDHRTSARGRRPPRRPRRLPRARREGSPLGAFDGARTLPLDRMSNSIRSSTAVPLNDLGAPGSGFSARTAPRIGHFNSPIPISHLPDMRLLASATESARFGHLATEIKFDHALPGRGKFCAFAFEWA